jgi:hypothetical protein
MGLKRQALRQTVDIMVRISGKDVARSLQATAARNTLPTDDLSCYHA